MKPSPLSPFFKPEGIVLSGISQDPNKLGYALARNLVKSGYPGAIHFVNPRGGNLFDRKVFSSIRDVPDPVDLAVLLVPPAFMLQSMEDIAKRGIRAAIIATGGFKEIGPEGAELEKKVAEFARVHDIRIVGPNCVGLIDTHFPMNTTFLQPPGPPAGEIAFLSHSGAICAAVIDWIRGQGAGLSHLISLGNQADVTETDMLPDVAADDRTRVITLYLESIRDGRKFIETARQITCIKPIVALKVGRFESGRRAAASHTGALAGQEAAYDAAFSKCGVLRANTTEEMFQWARALAWCPSPRGNRVAVLTNSGGPGVTAADALEQNGMKLAELHPETREALSSQLPPAASLLNPIDMLASATPDQFSGCLKTLLLDDGVDSVIVISPPPPPSTIGAVVKAMIPVMQALPEKPVLFALMGSEQIGEGVSLLHAAQIPDYRFPEGAASALGAVTRYAEFKRAIQIQAPKLGHIQKKVARDLMSSLPSDGWIPQDELLSLLEAYGISTSRLQLAVNREKAVNLADRMGYPVALKLASPDIPHKSDIGAVVLNLVSADEVRQGYDTVLQRARASQPEARIEGVQLQKMAGAGQEVICGFVRDPQFGPLMMFGSGGVEVEGLKDVAFGLAPLTQPEAEQMVDSTWAGRKLNGFRSIQPADREAVVDVLLRLSRLADDYPQIRELEVNPLRVLAKGEGGIAIDVRGRVISIS
jgi:acetate---CoA ligase (ADP-forming)